MEMIRRIHCGGTTYEYGMNWPGAKKLADDDLNQLTVGPMFFRYGTEEDQTDEDSSSWDVAPYYYEVWCVTRELYVSFWGSEASDRLGGTFQVDREKLRETLQRLAVTVRRIPYDKVDFADSEMPALEAFEEIKLRFLEIEGDEEAEVAEAEAEQIAASGNGQVATP